MVPHTDTIPTPTPEGRPKQKAKIERINAHHPQEALQRAIEHRGSSSTKWSI